MGVVVAKPHAGLHEAKHTSDRIEAEKNGPSVQHPAPRFKSENVEDSKHSAELLKMQHLNSGMSNTKSLKKSHSDTQKVQKSVSKPLGKQWYSDSKLPPRTRRDTIELKSPITSQLLRKSAGPPSPCRLKLTGRVKDLCKSASEGEDEYALEDSMGMADGSDEGTPPSSLTQLELVQAQRAKTCPPGLESVRLMSVYTDQNASMRKHQEDMFLYADPFPTSRTREGMFVVLDGHGGRECAELVFKRLGYHVLAALHSSSLAAGTTGKSSEQTMGVSVLDDVDRCIEKAFLTTDSETKAMRKCGTTAAMIYVHRRGDAAWIHVANVGDTRAVVCRGGKPSRITIDHTPKFEDEAQRIKACGGILLRNRVCGHLAVTRSFGDYNFKDSGVTAVPYQMRFPLTKEIQFIVIASDGLWDVLDDEAVTKFVLQSGTKNEWKVSQLLTDRAIELGSRDNITTMVIFF